MSSVCFSSRVFSAYTLLVSTTSSGSGTGSVGLLALVTAPRVLPAPVSALRHKGQRARVLGQHTASLPEPRPP